MLTLEEKAILAFQKEWPLEIARRGDIGPVVEETLDWLMDRNDDFVFFWGGRCNHEGCGPHRMGYHLRTCEDSLEGLRRHYHTLPYSAQPTFLYVRFKDNIAYAKFKLLWG